LRVFDIVFIGAGASSLMASSFLKNRSIAIIEASAKIAPKIKISGGGRCNFTNKRVNSQNYLGDSKLIETTFKSFGQKELLQFFDKNGLKYELRDNGKYFCQNSSSQIIEIFSRLTKGCEFFLGERVKSVSHKKNFIIKTDKQMIEAKKLVVSSGGLSCSSLGATEIGYEIAKQFGHTIVTPTPALVGFTLQKEQFWMKSLSGISLKVALHVEGKIFEEDMLFAHRGISGPSVLSASLYWKKGSIWIDFSPKIKISTLLRNKTKKQISSVLPFPKRFTKEYLSSISLDDMGVYKLKDNELKKLEELNHYEFSPAGNFGFSKAEVTRGGVDCSEISHLSFESIMQKNLYFIGEVLDVTGELGGYNFQWAFSSAVAMVKNMEQGL